MIEIFGTLALAIVTGAFTYFGRKQGIAAKATDKQTAAFTANAVAIEKLAASHTAGVVAVTESTRALVDNTTAINTLVTQQGVLWADRESNTHSVNTTGEAVTKLGLDQKFENDRITMLTAEIGKTNGVTASAIKDAGEKTEASIGHIHTRLDAALAANNGG